MHAMETALHQTTPQRLVRDTLQGRRHFTAREHGAAIV